MESLWPEIATKMTMVNLDAPNAVEAKGIGIEELFTLTDGKDTLGYYILLIVPSKLDKFDIAVFYNSEGKIITMKVLAYREDHGGEVGSKRWLKQFIGLGSNDPMKLNDDIQGISGATISCEAATKGAREATVFLNKWLQANKYD